MQNANRMLVFAHTKNDKGQSLRIWPSSHRLDEKSALWLVNHGHHVFDRLDYLANVERLAQEPVESAAKQALGVFGGHLAAHRDHFRELQIGIRFHMFADFAAVDVAQVHVQQDHVWTELFRGDSRGEAALGDFHFIFRFVFEDLFQDFNDVLLLIDDEDAGAAGHQAVKRHPVHLHEPDELVERNAPVFAAGNAVAMEGSAVEPFTDRARRNIADLGDLARGQNIFDFGRGVHWHFSLAETPAPFAGVWVVDGGRTSHCHHFLYRLAVYNL